MRWDDYGGRGRSEMDTLEKFSVDFVRYMQLFQSGVSLNGEIFLEVVFLYNTFSLFH